MLMWESDMRRMRELERLRSRSRRRLLFTASIVCLFSFLNLFPLAAPAMAGQGAAAPAGIIGQITDGTGAVLPGVTVTATGPALQVPSIVVVTDERGEYRLTPLPIGVYRVTYELAGFQNVRREGVQLTVGFTAKLDQVMNPGAVAETITVTGASPLVDVTSSATTTNLTQRAVDALPTTRDGLRAFLGQVPGVRTNLDVGAGGLSDSVIFRSYGQSGESWHMLEGIMGSASSAAGNNGSHYDFNVIDGSRVQTVGSNAEMPRRGILIDAIVKSGGNDFHGHAVGFGSDGRLEGTNIGPELTALGIRGTPALHNLFDVSGGLGGRIVRNKLWFYAAVRREGFDRDVLDVFFPDGTPVATETVATYNNDKVSYQMTPGNRLTAFYMYTQSFQRRGASRFVPPESREEASSPNRLWKGEWQAVRGNSFVTSVQYGSQRGYPSYAALSTDVATIDTATQFVTGAAPSQGRRRNFFRRHTKGTASWYKSDLFAGNHEFKAGVDHLFSGANDRWLSRDSGNYQLVFNNGAPFQINTWNYPVDPKNLGKYLGVYGQDSWTIARRLTLNLGLRFAHDNAYAPDQCHDASDFAAAACFPKIQLKIFNTFAPRVHAAYDLSGDGRTVIKGGWGRFDHLREIDTELTSTNRNNGTTTLWNWHDLNGDRRYQAGEVNLDPNGLDFQSLTGFTAAVPNPNQKQPKEDEFSLTFERELMANFGVRLTGIYARNFNVYRLLETQRPYEAYNIPITNRDPGPDGRTGTADDPGTSITYYDYATGLRGQKFAETMLINDPNADHTYKTIEVAANKRLARGWQFMTSYTATKIHQPFGTGTSPFLIGYNPNAEIFVANDSWEWEGRASGAYSFPYQILASVNYDHRSGAPQARQVQFTGGQAIRAIVLNVEPIGTLRLPATNLVDVRVGKRFTFGSARSLELRADVYNILNINTTTIRNLRSGSTYLIPTTVFGVATGSIILPRILQLGASFYF